MTSMGACSDFLFAMPSFLSGLARTLDLGSTFDAYNDSRTTEEADRRAIIADWSCVGNDLAWSMRTFEQTHPEPKQLRLGLVGQ